MRKNIVVIMTSDESKGQKYAADFCENAKDFSQIYTLKNGNTVDRLFDLYLPVEHRYIVVVGKLSDEEYKRIQNTSCAMFVSFIYSSMRKEDYELNESMTDVNGNLVDPFSLYDWVSNV